MKVLITRPRAQSTDFGRALQAAGFEPVYFPVIEIHPIENNAALLHALQNLDQYAWMVFTSVNAVNIVFDQFPSPRLRHLSPTRRGVGGEGIKVAAIGPKTSEALQARGVIPDFVPDEYVAESILPGLGDLHGKWVLLLRAEIARKALPEAIVAAGGTTHEIAVYRTLPGEINLESLAALKAGVDVVTLTSPSIVRNFIAIARQNGLDPLHLPGDPLLACIGPITEQAARTEGMVKLAVAKEYTTEGLIEVISQYANISEVL